MVSLGAFAQGPRFYRIAAGICALLLVTTALLLYSETLSLERARVVFGYYTTSKPSSPSAHYVSLLDPVRSKWHPIDQLIDEANTTFHALLQSSRSNSLADAAARYRARRGRHPPPGFDKWFEYAQNTSAVVVEEFFDRIESDIQPFWALNATVLAARAGTWHHRVSVRGGNTTMEGDVTGRVPWLELWRDLVKEAGEWLPDLDMPINYMDEPRLLVPFEEISRLVAEAQSTKRITPVNETKTAYSPIRADDDTTEPYDPEWLHAPTKYWDYARAACHPDTPGRHVPALADFSGPLPFPAEPYDPPYSHEGFVRNFTAATDPCLQPHLRGLHGTFISPISMQTATELIPLFGGSKLPVNNEVLIPGAMYLPVDEMYYGGDDHGPPWSEKEDHIIWRGVGSGGMATPDKWRGFQRHRMVEMLNGTKVSLIENRYTVSGETFRLPPLAAYDYPLARERKVGSWLSEKADVGFTNLLCGPPCSHLDPWYREVEGMKMKDQYRFKFAPDVDGNSFSGRFRGLLMSTSLPIKATVYAEWHDDRLKPWLHFVPVDNTFRDLYAVLDFFTSSEKGDAAAGFIAANGAAWAQQVLRREDMLLYTWRVLLEFARVCDEEREALGFVGDLL